MDKDLSDESGEDAYDEDYIPTQDKTCKADSGADSDPDISSTPGIGKKRKITTRASRANATKCDSESSDSDNEIKQEAQNSSVVQESDWDAFLSKYDGAKPSSVTNKTDAVLRKSQETMGANAKKSTEPISDVQDEKLFSKAKSTITGIPKDIGQPPTKLQKTVNSNIKEPTEAPGLNIISLPSASAGLQNFLKQRLVRPGISSLKSSEVTSSASGIGSVLEQIAQKDKKLSVLDKSKQDWDQFKCNSSITEEIKTANKGKTCYTERIAFLERVDWKTFEKEKEVRDYERKKRYQNETK